eukprot:s1479_g15.t1
MQMEVSDKDDKNYGRAVGSGSLWPEPAVETGYSSATRRGMPVAAYRADLRGSAEIVRERQPVILKGGAAFASSLSHQDVGAQIASHAATKK